MPTARIQPRKSGYCCRAASFLPPRQRTIFALISNWESGKAFPRKPRLQQLVAALEQPPASGSGTHNWFVARSKKFGEQLRAWRKARGLRQMDACAALGLPPIRG